MSARFLQAKMVIESLRDNGYNNTAYALGELVDNSIQAGATIVELGFLEEQAQTGARRNYSVTEISIWDNGEGMSPTELRKAMQFGGGENRNDREGMGKFGMGLPNSSISQCKRVDVWSWQGGNDPFYTYLDVAEMARGDLEEVPEPVTAKLPKKYQRALFSTMPASGTLVIWSELDRLNWRTGKSIYTHCENLVGRMYRNFIDSGKVRLSARTYRPSGEDLISGRDEQLFRANDPSYLMKNTSLDPLPGHYSGEAFFELVDEEKIHIEYENLAGDKVAGTVEIKSSIVKQSAANEILKNESQRLGATAWGRHCRKNTGVSILRAGRELVLRDGFLSQSLRESKGRFIGIEVSFPPSLDELFGVLNNKQDAVNLIPYDKKGLAASQGFELQEDYMQDLEENGDPLVHVFTVTDKINLHVKNLETRLKSINIEGQLAPGATQEDGSKASAGQRATAGEAAAGDQREQPALTVPEVKRDLISEGLDPGKAEEIVAKGLRYHIDERAIDSDAFFDVSRKQGLTLVILNTNHVFYKLLVSHLDEDDRITMETALAGFASVMNDESSNEQRINYLNAVRRSWGKKVNSFLMGPSSEEEFGF